MATKTKPTRTVFSLNSRPIARGWYGLMPSLGDDVVVLDTNVHVDVGLPPDIKLSWCDDRAFYGRLADALLGADQSVTMTALKHHLGKLAVDKTVLGGKTVKQLTNGVRSDLKKSNPKWAAKKLDAETRVNVRTKIIKLVRDYVNASDTPTADALAAVDKLVPEWKPAD